MSISIHFTENLTLAKNAYAIGNLTDALSFTSQLACDILSQRELDTCAKEVLMEYLDALTLHQSLLALTNRTPDYLCYEASIQKLTYLLFSSDADFYYAIHLFDSCETMAMNQFLTEASSYKNQALSLLQKQLGDCTYLHFMEGVCNAQIAFYLEDYYTCIEAASKANTLWYTPSGEQITIPRCPNASFAAQIIERIGINNVLLMCNAYGKINHPKESITLLENTLAQNAFDHYQTISAEITLTQLYLIDGQRERALPLYEKYKNSNFTSYPGLAAALNSISYIFETEPTSFTDALSTNQYCYSQDMFVVSRYNYALGLISQEKYEEALTQLQSLGERGYSLQLAVLSHLHRTTEIEALEKKTNQYFYRQINQIIAHFDEEIAFNHLSLLQYHIDLVLGAYCNSSLRAPDAYSFLLNTKYISLETTHLLKTKQERTIYNSTQIMERLSGDYLLLEYTCTRTLNTVCYGVFVVSSKEISYIPLGEAFYIDSLLAEWHNTLQASAKAVGREASLLLSKQQSLNTKLRKALYLPIKALVTSGKQLLIAPAGALISFPFSQLSTSANGFLGDANNIRYLNTGKELLENTIFDTTALHNTSNALVIGNPKTNDFPNLPYAEEEADMVAYFLQAVSLKKEEASLPHVLELLKNPPALLHIAAHGVYQTPACSEDVNWDMLYKTMTQSGIVLADDTLLSCAQIGTLNLTNTRLAVLSCCHSGQSAYLATEGAYGLRRAFRVAGCQTIIANLWQIDDTVSFLWMKAFYEALTISSISIDEAFSSACDTIRHYEEEGTFPYAHPYYWAGFVLI